MNNMLMLIIAFAATLFGGIAIGFMLGITKGMVLGASFRTGRPVSSIPWMLCFIMSGVFLLSAVGTSIYSIYFLASSVPTMAKVIEVIETKNNEGGVSRSHVYSYKSATGGIFTDRSSDSVEREFEVGDVMPIRYLKNSPHQSRIDYFSHHWLLPIIMGVFSIAIAGFGFGMRWWRNKEQIWASKTLAASGGNASAQAHDLGRLTGKS